MGNLKKFTLFALLLSVLLAATGCKAAKPANSTPKQSSNDPVFMLDQLPDIGEYVDDVIYTRRYPEFRDTLTPGEDYGKLIPYVGSFRDYHLVDHETGQWTDARISVSQYGLMTTSGQIVVDAVFDSFSIEELADGDYILTLYQSSDDYETAGRQLMCNSTGAWVAEADSNVYFHFGAWDDGFIIVSDYSQVDYSNQTGVPKVAFYDKGGNYLFGFDNCVSGSLDGFRDGYIVLDFFTDYFAYEYTSRFVDKTGNIAFPQVSANESFQNGKAPVTDSSGLCGIMSADGSWVLEPMYQNLYRLEDHYIASDGLTNTVLDQSGEPLATATENISICGGKIFLDTYEYDEDTYNYRHHFTDVLTNKVLICRETGNPVTQHFNDTDYFYCDDGTDTYIVDQNGNTVAKLDGLGALYKIDDAYFYMIAGTWSDNTQLYSMYSFHNFEKLWSQEQKNTGNEIHLRAELGYIVRSHYPLLGGLGIIPHAVYDILDMETGEPIFEGLTNYSLLRLDGRSYLFLSDEYYTYGYDQDMHLLIKTRNQTTD